MASQLTGVLESDMVTPCTLCEYYECLMKIEISMTIAGRGITEHYPAYTGNYVWKTA